MAKFFSVDDFRYLVRNWLRSSGTTTTEAARAMKISSRTLYNFLDGNTPSVETLDLMARYLNGGAGVYLP